MSNYQWFKEHCLKRQTVYDLLLISSNFRFLRQSRFIDTLHNKKVSLNRIIHIQKYKNYIVVDFYSRRRNSYRCFIWL